ncbi:hypothetical protein FRB90_005996 [Tulasnella sp. 427]|nr:hypothetical protein FRB90_005996 [Tulasnella sp. 427]
MSTSDNLRTKLRQADKAAKVAEIYEEYVFSLVKAKRDATHELDEQMLELEARMSANARKQEEEEALVKRYTDSGNWMAAGASRQELVRLFTEYWMLRADETDLFLIKSPIDGERKLLEQQRSEMVDVYWAILDYATRLEQGLLTS